MKVDYRTLQFFGNSVKFYREKRGLTRADLADSVSCRTQTIARIERGSYIPTLWLASAIAFVLGVSVNDLYQDFYIREIKE